MFNSPGPAEGSLDPGLVLYLRASKYYMLSSTVILYFDYLLTFDSEVRNLWRRRWSVPGILFLLNRYYPMLAYVIVLASIHDASWSGEVCERFKRFPLFSALASEAIIGIIVMLRLYALHVGSWIVFLLLPLYAVQLVFGVWAGNAVVQATGIPPGSGCIINVPSEATYRFVLFWISSAVFDVFVFLLTICRVLRLRFSGLKVPLTTIFLRDGVVYFVVMFLARFLNFILFWTAVTPSLVTLNWTINNTITIIMMNRLVLNLRRESSKSTILAEKPRNFTNTGSLLSEIVVAELGGSIPREDEAYQEIVDAECDRRRLSDSFLNLEMGNTANI